MGNTLTDLVVVGHSVCDFVRAGRGRKMKIVYTMQARKTQNAKRIVG